MDETSEISRMQAKLQEVFGSGPKPEIVELFLKLDGATQPRAENLARFPLVSRIAGPAQNASPETIAQDPKLVAFPATQTNASKRQAAP